MLIETENYIDASEAARILGVGRSTIAIHCKAGRFEGQVRIGHFWAIPRESVENFQRRKPGAKPKVNAGEPASE